MNYPNAIPADTTPDAHRMQIAVLRKLGARRRAAMTFELNEAMLRRIAGGVRQRHPDYDDERVRLATIRIRLGETWFRRAFPAIQIEP